MNSWKEKVKHDYHRLAICAPQHRDTPSAAWIEQASKIIVCVYSV